VEQLGPDRGRRGPRGRGAQQEDGPELQVHGSGDLIQTLLRHDLVDEYRLLIFPLVIGSGKRLFSEGTVPAGLKLLDSTVSTRGS
jgi:dihydrofolate reductase